MQEDWPFGRNQSATVQIRRDLHAYPEVGFLEFRTAAKAASYLDKLGYNLRVGPEVMVEADMLGRPPAAIIEKARIDALAEGASPEWVARMPRGQTGIVAELRRGSGPVLAFRFEMDALPVNETKADSHKPNRDGYRSQKDGFMHACAHDGHTAIGLAVAERLAQATAKWQGTVKLIFQPAEEGGRGAFPMVQAGVVDDVDFFFAAHLGVDVPTGTVATEARGFLFSKRMDVFFRGVASHAAVSPQLGRNALLAGAAAALNLHGIARVGNAVTHVNVGTMTAGTGRNIIPDECKMMMEVRGNTEAALSYMARRADEIIAAASAMNGCTFETVVVGQNIAAENSPLASAIVSNVASRVTGVTDILPFKQVDGCDDATFMIDRVRKHGGVGTYFIVGSDLGGAHHAIDFDIDEASLEHAVQIFTGIAEEVLAPKQ